MNEIVKRGTQSESINVFGSGFELAQRMAQLLAASQVVPTMYQGNMPNCMIALDISNRIGVGVLAVMQKMYIVHGKPAFEATFVAAAVNSCGRYTPIRCHENGLVGDDFGVYAVAKELSTGEELRGTTITWKMIKAEKWDSKPGSKWLTMPEQMFKYRAMSFWQREFDPGLTMGIRTADEIEDMDVSPAEVVNQDRGLAAVTAELKVKAAEELSRPVSQGTVTVTAKAKEDAPQEPIGEVEVPSDDSDHAAQLKTDCIDMAFVIWGEDHMQRISGICRGSDRDCEYPEDFESFAFTSATTAQLEWLHSELKQRS
jgi:hypothetical protein